MHECSSGATVAVDERVNRFELRVGDRSPDDGVATCAGDEVCQVCDESRHLRRGRWDEVGTQRTVARPSDPVLLGSQARLQAWLDRVLRIDDVCDSDMLSRIGKGVDGVLGSSNIGNVVECNAITVLEEFSDREFLRREPVSLEPRRRDALRADEQVVEIAAAR